VAAWTPIPLGDTPSVTFRKDGILVVLLVGWNLLMLPATYWPSSSFPEWRGIFLTSVYLGLPAVGFHVFGYLLRPVTVDFERGGWLPTGDLVRWGFIRKAEQRAEFTSVDPQNARRFPGWGGAAALDVCR
jgi:hypothetical protein